MHEVILAHDQDAEDVERLKNCENSDAINCGMIK